MTRPCTTESTISSLLHEICDRMESTGASAAWSATHFQPDTKLGGVVFTVVCPSAMIDIIDRGLHSAAQVVFDELLGPG